ncbi:type II toxin-antitoxin system RelE/ParE family toxin [Cyclobacterium roseum]|uniref:type II toxin-antitoxin system RelE/ParE family toxin n=1 Tax=Cyclobacterium roseum TaxID=2666137 RepID=UPI001391A41C|nr:type II toxin-antitoxin system RelE/ParE family toxin [Cyclobacterium roseum]
MVEGNPVENFSKQRPTVSWTKSAFISLQKAYKKIKENSPASAEKVKDTILFMTRNLADHPEKYPLDRFKKDNPGSYRAFEKYSYRVAYRHTDSEIKILRVRHVKQEPKSY